MALSGFRVAAGPSLPAALAVLLLLSPGGCGQEKAPEATAPPGGIIREIQADSSITTDVNARAPAFAREDSQGQVVRTQDFIGRQVLLLDFWSVFCQSCLQEIPFLVDLYGRYSSQGLQIVSVNTDFFPQARIESFMEKTGMDLPFPLVLDRDQSLSRLFQVDALPVTVLIDSSGWIRMVHLGYRPGDRDMIESRVRQSCRRIKEAVVTLQPVEGKTAFAPPGAGGTLLEAGASVPDFSAFDSGGTERSFAALRRGGPALVFFWSLFCQPCREEFPRLATMAGQYAPRGLAAFAINVDSGKLRPAASKFLEKQGGDLTPLYDLLPDGTSGGAARSLGVTSTPSLILVGGDGRIRFAAAGEALPEKVGERIEEMLSAPSAAAEPETGSRER